LTDLRSDENGEESADEAFRSGRRSALKMDNSANYLAPPPDATVLFDGKDASAWVMLNGGKPFEWTVKDGYMEVKPKAGDVVTVERFGDFELHLEFWLPLMADQTSQARANSGLYLQGLYEIQILDSFDNETYSMGECGALYMQAPVLLNASLPPERWQTYDVVFRAPLFDAEGSRVKDGSVTIRQNGQTIHNETPITEPTGGAMKHSPSEPGPVRLQDHSNRVRFRNLWIRRLNPEA
jgi:hypothetical protein